MVTSCGFESHRPHQPSLAKRMMAAAPEGEAPCVRELRLGKPIAAIDGLHVAQPRQAKRVRHNSSLGESDDGRRGIGAIRGLTMPFLTTITIAPDLIFDTLVAGEAGAPLVLLLHGFAETMHCWGAQLTALG